MGAEGAEQERAAPLCRTPGAAAAATDLLLALVAGCVANMAALADLLDQMFYSGWCTTYVLFFKLHIIETINLFSFSIIAFEIKIGFIKTATFFFYISKYSLVTRSVVFV